ncbi:MAG: nickel pincer cofactor biosynthesis protein LarB [Candidatus Micrarchaeota archaeon]
MRDVERILKDLARGRISLARAMRLLRVHGIARVEEMARVDSGREMRTRVPEIILAEGKTPSQIVAIAKKFPSRVILSRVGDSHLRALRKNFKRIKHNPLARIVVVEKGASARAKTGSVGVIAAGTSDVPVAEEAIAVAEAMGCSVMRAYDVGVAGIHRLLAPLKKMINEVDVFVVVAGREGTLPAIVAGMVDVPVIGVPTSTGYGFGGKGEAALKSMLQSCSFLTVVNIDNGVGAGACAALIAKRTRAANATR